MECVITMSVITMSVIYKIIPLHRKSIMDTYSIPDIADMDEICKMSWIATPKSTIYIRGMKNMGRSVNVFSLISKNSDLIIHVNDHADGSNVSLERLYLFNESQYIRNAVFKEMANMRK